ncbi:MAG TPA: hypothetical protein VGQ78_04630 [Vicinamibacteria bacterium]|nr:hypothetical protein [Vicinamibacteria bacterium]
MTYPSRRGQSSGSFLQVALAMAALGAAGYIYLLQTQKPAAPAGARPAAPAAAAPAGTRPQVVFAPANPPTAVEQPTQPAAAAAQPRSEGALAAPAGRAQTVAVAPAASRGVPPAAAPAMPGQKPAAAPAPAVARSFAVGRTEAENVRGVSQSLEGFRKKREVHVKRMPEVDGMIHFEVTPATVRAGDRYTLKTYLIHSGKKAIAIDNMTVSTSVDGSRSASRVSPLAKKVPPGMHVLLDQRSGVVKPGTRSWAMEVAVTSDHRDVYRNSVTLR